MAPDPARLAIDGGEPIRTEPWPPWPSFPEDEIDAAKSVLQSGRVSYWTGDEGRHLEKELATRFGTKHAVAVANGSVAIELALRALEIASGDVVVPSRTFVATASGVALMGARPVFADVDRDSGNISAETLAAAATPQTRAVIVVHLGGWPVDIEPIRTWCTERGVALIEDCAQAHGATIGGQPVGSLSDVATFSFCQDKILTAAGEGGAVLMNDEEMWQTVWSFKDHGKSWRAVYEQEHPPGFRWLHKSLGTNLRMTEVQSAVLRRQLAKLDEFVAARREFAVALAEHLRGHTALRLPLPQGGSFYRLYAYVVPGALADGWDRDRVMRSVAAEGVPCFSGSCSEVYREEAFARPHPRLPVARELGETSLCFLVHPTQGAQELSDTKRAVDKVMSAATKT